MDFKQIAEGIDVAAVAKVLGLQLSKDHRAHCPVCDSDRAIQLFPETNSFRCHAAELSGDCIGLYAHAKGYQGMYKAAKELSELFADATAPRATVQATSPQKPEGRTAQAQPAPTPRQKPEGFDPVAFAGKLAFSEEVAALGFTEELAERFSIGFYRGKVYLPMRDPNGAISGFIGYSAEGLKLPPTWLPPTMSTVVPFAKKSA